MAFCSAALQLFRLNKRDKGQVLCTQFIPKHIHTHRVSIAADIYRRQGFLTGEISTINKNMRK